MSTTFDRIVRLYERAGQLLAQEHLTEAEQQQFRDLRAELDQQWNHRRAELTFQTSGPPVFMGGGDTRDQQRHIAHGIAPLPRGGA